MADKKRRIIEALALRGGIKNSCKCDGHCDILLHRPHPQKELKEYVVKDLHYLFEQEGFWNE